jgi:hypothetical protein
MRSLGAVLFLPCHNSSSRTQQQRQPRQAALISFIGALLLRPCRAQQRLCEHTVAITATHKPALFKHAHEEGRVGPTARIAAVLGSHMQCTHKPQAP